MLYLTQITITNPRSTYLNSYMDLDSHMLDRHMLYRPSQPRSQDVDHHTLYHHTLYHQSQSQSITSHSAYPQPLPLHCSSYVRSLPKTETLLFGHEIKT